MRYKRPNTKQVVNSQKNSVLKSFVYSAKYLPIKELNKPKKPLKLNLNTKKNPKIEKTDDRE